MTTSVEPHDAEGRALAAIYRRLLQKADEAEARLAEQAQEQNDNGREQQHG